MSEKPPQHELLSEPTPLSDAELTELERLSKEATGRPWMVERETLKIKEEHKETHKENPAFAETSIHTAWHQGQIRGPAPVVTTGWGPWFTPSRFIYMREEDADFIVAACNATRRLLAEVRSLRKQLKKNA